MCTVTITVCKTSELHAIQECLFFLFFDVVVGFLSWISLQRMEDNSVAREGKQSASILAKLVIDMIFKPSSIWSIIYFCLLKLFL